jgi:hypothetical protein
MPDPGVAPKPAEKVECRDGQELAPAEWQGRPVIRAVCFLGLDGGSLGWRPASQLSGARLGTLAQIEQQKEQDA